MPDLRTQDLRSEPSAAAGPRQPLGGPPSPPGAIIVDLREYQDGSVDITIGDPIEEAANDAAEADGSASFGDNLAPEVESGKLVDDLLRGITADIASRTEWSGIYARGLDLLGLKPEERTTGPRKFSSTVRHPLLLMSIIEGQARARGELLPADGPVKVRNDGKETQEAKQRADDLQTDANHFLTVTASEYYPDTDRGLFYLYYGGVIFKKVYRCPIRKRPASECVYAPDLILSNDTTDLENCRRMTHKIEMSRDEVERLIADEFYQDVPLTQPTPSPDPVQAAEAKLSGIQAVSQLPEDADHVLYECYTNIDLKLYGFASDKGVRPYVVTFDRDSQQLYSIRRFWKEDDEDYKRRKRFVKYGLVPGMGFLDYGYVHILGANTRALTAIERIMIDAGMFSNYPAGLRSRGARLESNEIIAGPGEFPEVDASPANGDISKVIMKLPFAGPSAELFTLYTHIEEVSAKLAGSVSIEVGEGRTNIPVGTIMAQIEQQTQVMSAVHKRLHTAQQEEFIILKELWAEDPSVLSRNELDPIRHWTSEELMDADLVPASDPNVPAHVHRIMQAVALEQLATAHPEIYDQREVQKRLLSIARLGDPDQLFIKTPPAAQTQPDPNAGVVEATTIQAQAKLAEADIRAQTDRLKALLDNQARTLDQQMKEKDLLLRQRESTISAQEAEDDRKSREAIAAMQAQTQLILKGLEQLNAPQASPEPARDDKAGPG